MANIVNPEENEQNSQSQGSPVSQTGGLSGGASTPSAATNNTPQPKGSGRFTNIQKYLDANQGAGQKLAGGIKEKSDEYTSSIREGIESSKNIQQGVQDEQNRVGQAGYYSDKIQNDSVAAANENLDDITKLRLGQSDANKLYGQGVQTVSNIQTNLNPLDQMGQNLGTEGGRFQVLQDVYGGAYKPQYNMGQRRLDQTLLQSQGGNELNELQKMINQSVSEGQDSLSGLNQTLGQDIGSLRYGTQDAKNQILSAIGDFGTGGGGALGTLRQDFGTEQAAREAELQNYLNTARGQFGSGTVSQNTADMLGFTGTENVSDLDLTDYANKNIQLGDTDVTMADVIGRSNLDPRLNALSQLAGTTRDDYDLGVAEGQDLSFDANKFSQDAASQRDTYEDRYFDKEVYKMLGPESFGQDYYNSVVDSGKTIGDYLGSYDGSQQSGGQFSASPWYDRLEDPTSREQLVEASTGVAEKDAAGWIGGLSPDRFAKLLDMFDQQRNRTFGIGDAPDDLESGGNFNVN